MNRLWVFAELASVDDAALIGFEIDRRKIGGGVKPLTDDPKTSGLYVAPWLQGDDGFVEPQVKKGDPCLKDAFSGEVIAAPYDAFYYLFRFQNGFEGVTVGLVRTEIAIWAKYSPERVYTQLAAEVGPAKP